MPNKQEYKEMYLTMAREVEKAVRILIDASKNARKCICRQRMVRSKEYSTATGIEIRRDVSTPPYDFCWGDARMALHDERTGHRQNFVGRGQCAPPQSLSFRDSDRCHCRGNPYFFIIKGNTDCHTSVSTGSQ